MKTKTFGLALSTLFLVACGGDEDGKKGNSSSSISSSSIASIASSSATSLISSSSQSSSVNPLYSLGGNVSGLDGNLELKAGDQTLTINSNGDFTFPTMLAVGTQVSLSLSAYPFRQTCTINGETQRTLQTNINDISITCAPLGVLNGTISNYHTGSPIDQAQVTVTALDDEGNVVMNATTQTDETGAFELQGLGISNRFVLNAWSNGFATRNAIFANSAAHPNVTHSALVLRANETSTFSASSAANLTVDGDVLVELPANAFVTANGTAASGTITPSLTIIDPSGDAGVMPGNYEVRNAETGAISLIESFGAIDVSFRDAAGNLLQLAPNTSANISIPMASSINIGAAPQTIPLFYFDETTGYWVEEGEAALIEDDGQYFYRGTVTHFTTWNADRVYETVNVRGCVRDADNNPLANVRIVASGRDYIGQSIGYSDASGAFLFPVRRESSILLTSISGSQSDTVAITSGSSETLVETCLQLAESSATITLTWGENPQDLDSHWFVPGLDIENEYQIYFGNKTQEVNGVVFDLDVDDTSSFGPEVVTVPDFPHAGIYRYVVRLYSGSGTIADSPARVELNLRGQIHVFSPSEASGDKSEDFWHVFNIRVEEDGSASVVAVQNFADDRYPENTVVSPQTKPNAANLNSRSTTKKQPSVVKETKYYAE